MSNPNPPVFVCGRIDAGNEDYRWERSERGPREATVGTAEGVLKKADGTSPIGMPKETIIYKGNQARREEEKEEMTRQEIKVREKRRDEVEVQRSGGLRRAAESVLR